MSKWLVLTLIGFTISLMIVNERVYAYSTAYIDQNLRLGVQSAINWDSCRSNLTSTQTSQLRDNINGRGSWSSCAYAGELWLSGSGKPKVLAPIDVESGTTQISLQINAVRFLTGSLVTNEISGATGVKVRDDAKRWVVSPTDANDRSPNPIGNSGQRPALVDTYRKVTRVEVETGGGSVSGGVGEILETRRNSNSRYWLATPTQITYENPNITDGLTVQVRVYYKEINSYYNPWNAKNGKYYDIYCTSWSSSEGDNNEYRSSATAYDFGDINNCAPRSTSLSIQFNIQNYYTLTPTTTLNSTAASPGENVNGTASVSMSGSGGVSDNTTWSVHRFVYSNSSPSDTSSKPNSSVVPCDAFSGETSCNLVASSPENTVFSSSLSSKSFTSSIPTNIGTNSRVCFVTSVSRPTESSTPLWSHSQMRCFVISSTPKFQVWGGDLRVNGFLRAGLVSNGSSLFGSWGEYGVFSTGINTYVASGAGLNDGNTDGSGNGWNRLTFSNTNALQRGLFTTSLPGQTFYGGFYTNDENTLSNPSSVSLTNKDGFYTSAANITITDGTIDQNGGVGRSIIVRSPGTIRIAGNIIYDDSGGLTDVSQVPQVVIVANHIEIEGGVNRIDAWLLTTGLDGSINTCIDRTLAQPLNNTVCSQQLTVNGPVATSNLHLRRTAQSNQPDGVAEIFNLRADALLWAYGTTVSKKKLQTVHSVELAPRF